MKAREAMIRGMFTPATSAAVQQHVLKMMLAPPEATASGAMIATFDTADLNDFCDDRSRWGFMRAGRWRMLRL